MDKKKKIILFSIIGGATLIIIAVIITIIILANNKPKTVTITDETDEQTAIIEVDEEEIKSKTVDDYTAKEVLGISLGKIVNAKEFEVTTTGSSSAVALGSVNVSVNIANHRIVKDGEAFIQCVSYSSMSMGTAGSQRFLSGGNVALRKATKVNEDATAEFGNDEVEIINNDEYLTRYGWLPYQMNGYIINDNTYLEDPTVSKNEDDTYTLYVKLDPNSDAATYYKREVATNAGATKEPVFKKIEFEITIDNSFVIQKVKTHEEYDVTVNMFIDVTSETSTDCVDVYNYDNISFDEELYSYYKNKLAS